MIMYCSKSHPAPSQTTRNNVFVRRQSVTDVWWDEDEGVKTDIWRFSTHRWATRTCECVDASIFRFASSNGTWRRGMIGDVYTCNDNPKLWAGLVWLCVIEWDRLQQEDHDELCHPRWIHYDSHWIPATLDYLVNHGKYFTKAYVWCDWLQTNTECVSIFTKKIGKIKFCFFFRLVSVVHHSWHWGHGHDGS